MCIYIYTHIYIDLGLTLLKVIKLFISRTPTVKVLHLFYFIDILKTFNNIDKRRYNLFLLLKSYTCLIFYFFFEIYLSKIIRIQWLWLFGCYACSWLPLDPDRKYFLVIYNKKMKFKPSYKKITKVKKKSTRREIILLRYGFFWINPNILWDWWNENKGRMYFNTKNERESIFVWDPPILSSWVNKEWLK